MELPDENARKKLGLIARLNEAMYGLRETPIMLQRVVRDTMRKLGFRALTAAQYIITRRRPTLTTFCAWRPKEKFENLLRQQVFGIQMPQRNA